MIVSIRPLGVSVMALALLFVTACSPSPGRIEGDVFGVLNDGTTHRFAATRVFIVPSDSGVLQSVRLQACEPYWSVMALWRDRLYAPEGDLMDLTLRVDSLKIRLAQIQGRAEPGALAGLAVRRQRSDSAKDALERLRVASLKTIDSVLTAVSVTQGSTDVNGHYVLDSIRPGTYRVVVLASLGDTGLALPSMIGKYGLEPPTNDDWVWMLRVTVAAKQSVREDLSPLNRVPGNWRIREVCTAVDSALVPGH